MKKIGFLSFGHWTPSPQSQTRSAADALLQSIDLAVVAEALAVAAATGECFYEAELHRLRGELLLRQAASRGRSSPAEAAPPTGP